LSTDWQSEIDECISTLLSDRDHDVRLSVSGVFQTTTKSLSTLSLYENTSEEDQANV